MSKSAGYTLEEIPRPRTIAEQVAFQRRVCAPISPIYGRVLGQVVDDLVRGGPCARVLADHEGVPYADAVVLRFLGAVHRLVLDDRAPGLAAYYPSAGGRPGPDLEQAFVATVEDHAPELERRLADPIQTNEVGRSAALLGGYLATAALGFPLRVLEVGSSAGLNLRWDHFRYTAGSTAFGPAGSAVCFEDPWVGPAPDLATPVSVVARRGCDRTPVDPTDPDGQLTLRSFVWPDQLDRLGRLDAAIEISRGVPATVDKADAPGWLALRLAHLPPGLTTVVVHSIVVQYLALDTRRAVVGAIEDAGRRATPDAPVAWLRMEPGGDVAETRLTIWPGGAERLIATSGYHGPPVRWLG